MHEVVEEYEHGVTANTSAICRIESAMERDGEIWTFFQAHSPRERMRKGVPLVVSLRRSPEGSITAAIHQASGPFVLRARQDVV